MKGPMDHATLLDKLKATRLKYPGLRVIHVGVAAHRAFWEICTGGKDRYYERDRFPYCGAYVSLADGMEPEVVEGEEI